jgi:hypothetical protein
MRGGESIGLEDMVDDGERIGVYPMFEALDVRPLLRLRPQPLRHPRFVADAHLGALAKRLRILGFDTLWHNDFGDSTLADLAAREHRTLDPRPAAPVLFPTEESLADADDSPESEHQSANNSFWDCEFAADSRTS